MHLGLAEVVLLVVFLVDNASAFFRIDPHPDALLSIGQIVTKYGYEYEDHPNIETKDGYLLTLQRIPRRSEEPKESTKKKPVVLLMHGIFGSAENWILVGPNESLAYVLSDLGYDVWMGNCRGTKPSRNHRSYDPDRDNKFWQFTWHEMGTYDLPAMIDYILEQTGQSQLAYVGHSQGTTAFFVMASQFPEYDKKVKVMVAFAPVAFVKNLRHPALRYLAANHKALEMAVKRFNLYEVLPIRHLLWDLGRMLCSERFLLNDICSSITFSFTGASWELADFRAVSLMFSKFPDDISTLQIIHYAQEVVSGRFRMYDHGVSNNMARYKRLIPPEYNVKRITTPIGLFYGLNDKISTEKDVNTLSKKLRNVVWKEAVPHRNFTHLDFLVGKNLDVLVHKNAIRVLNKYMLNKL